MLEEFKFKVELKLPILFLTMPLFSSPYSDIPIPFNFTFFVFDLLHFRLLLSFVIHLSLIVNKFSSTLFSALDDTPTVELSLKLDEVLNWLSRYYIFSSMHNISCHCFCITPFFISFSSIKWYPFPIYFQTLYYVEFYLRIVGFSHWFAGFFPREVNYFISYLEICCRLSYRRYFGRWCRDSNVFCRITFFKTFPTFFAAFPQVVVDNYCVSCIIRLISLLSCRHKY